MPRQTSNYPVLLLNGWESEWVRLGFIILAVLTSFSKCILHSYVILRSVHPINKMNRTFFNGEFGPEYILFNYFFEEKNET